MQTKQFNKLFLATTCATLSAAAVADTYTYDNLNRLTAVTFANGSGQTYSYDAGGNLLSIRSTGGVPQVLTITPVSGASAGTSVVSAPITVAGVVGAASISITNGEYQINGGAWTNVAGTVSNGDTVKVRITASATPSAVIRATLTIGISSGDFVVTTAAAVTPPPTPTPAPVDTSPPPTPTVPADGNIGNTASSGGDLLVIGNTTLKAGSNGGQIQATGVAGTSTVAVTSGSVGIPCTVAGNFCKSGQTTLPVLAGESVKFTADGKVSSIQITPPTPSSNLARLNGKSLMDAVVATLQANVPTLGTETGRSANDWSALGIGFSSGKLSVAAQLPMQVNPALADGVSLLPNGTVQVTTQGVVVNLAPSLVDSSSFTTALQTLNPNAQIRFSTDGTIGIGYNQALFSLRPSLFTAAPDSSPLTIGSDGILRFGNQSIPPATYNFDQFSAMLANVDATAQVSVQADGKLVVLLKGAQYTLVPDYQVFVATTPNPIGFVIRDGKLVVNYQFGFSQGFTVGR